MSKTVYVLYSENKGTWNYWSPGSFLYSKGIIKFSGTCHSTTHWASQNLIASWNTFLVECPMTRVLIVVSGLMVAEPSIQCCAPSSAMHWSSGNDVAHLRTTVLWRNAAHDGTAADINKLVPKKSEVDGTEPATTTYIKPLLRVSHQPPPRLSWVRETERE